MTLAVVTAADGEVELLTPCGNTMRMGSGEPIYEVDVVIDPGHGGPVDTGAVAPDGLEEKEMNLRVGLAAREALVERGISVALTRTGDYPIPIRTRVEYAHLMGAEVVVSIHHNAPLAPSSEIPGVEIFVQRGSDESQRLGGLLYDEAMEALGGFDVDWDRALDAGVMTVLNSEGNDAYGMVRLPNVPSALVELGYIVNQAEAELFRTPGYVKAAGTSVADAIESFLTSDQTGAGLAEGRTFNPRPGVGRDQCVEPDLDLSLYPDVTNVEVTRSGDGVAFEVTISSPYDSADRYADAFRVVGDDGRVYGVRELIHDHANEQPFTRNLGTVEIPATVDTVTVEARDQVYGWGGEAISVVLP
ncbi:MAG: N-acetylmuramoyl-L-alanine amidase [Acidimicrobiia bacterium]